MRENRTHGSEGGETGQPAFPTPIKARAFRSDLTPSNITSATYQIKAPTPTFSPDFGVYMEAQTVTIACAEPTATIYYTTDGSEPTDDNPSSQEYQNPVSISTATELKAKAYKQGWIASDTKSASYAFGGWDLASMWSDTNNPNDMWTYGYYDGGFLATLSEHVDNLWGAYGPAWINPGPQIPNMMKAVKLVSNTIPIGHVGGHGPAIAAGQLGYAAAQWTAPRDTAVDIVGATWWNNINLPDRPVAMAIFIDGAPLIEDLPLPMSASASDPFTLADAIVAVGGDAGDLQALSVQTGQTIMFGIKALAQDGNWYVMDFALMEVQPDPKVMSVRVSPASGIYADPISVTMSCFTAGADIRYTTDGSDPTATSDQYTGAIAVSQPTTIKARAFKDGMAPSIIRTMTYWIGAPPSAAMSTLKGRADGQDAATNAVAVTAVFGDSFYVEELDRSAGIRVDLPGHTAAVGRTVLVMGKIMTDAVTGERYIQGEIMGDAGEGGVEPLIVTGKSLGGGPSGLQEGVESGSGLSNIGLLVKATGRVISPADGVYYLDDGSGVNVKVTTMGALPTENSYVAVTGISSCEKDGAALTRVIKALSFAQLQAAP
ncbi:MAG: chitobiase/beta-hexosaminidase C-terminal domain-containing protein [Armatimonadetes bacterium]|nr:chitobiase/beta-hexosaminidase C-terminal domain-containing protein [Armatimonadota bacterium]